MKSWVKVLFTAVLFISLFSFGCGGGGGGGSTDDGGGPGPESTYAISGTVSINGGALAGATITLSGAGSGSVTTDANGYYSFSSKANGAYTVTPSMAGYIFTPASKVVTVNSANSTANDFTATAISGSTYSISGTITKSTGGGLSGVTITLSGVSTGTATTDAGGNYTLSGLANGAYSITPTLVGYTFMDASKAVTVNSSDVTGADFIATANINPTYSISGTITKSGGGALAGATVTLSGASTGTATSDAGGAFSFSSLAKGSYTITPSLSGYTFSPANKAVTVNGANVTAINFTATAIPNDPITSLLNSFVPIPGGTFMMGSTDNQYGRAQYTTPVHAVTLQGFEISAYEVTQAQYQAVMGVNPSYFKGENNPVETVSWYDARAFCTALSAMTGRTFTLPSEAQWEYACRAGTTTLYSYGDSDTLLGDYAWYYTNSGSRTHTVGAKLPNNWGLYDMMGNVYEWCLDSWHTNYTGAPTDGSAWEPETGSSRMIRGSTWNIIYPRDFRSAWRQSSYPDRRTGAFGFRVVAIR